MGYETDQEYSILYIAFVVEFRSPCPTNTIDTKIMVIIRATYNVSNNSNIKRHFYVPTYDVKLLLYL